MQCDFHKIFSFLRRYKYILLLSGLILSGLTLIFGTNPQGIGPRLWLGCCGVYFQPSEPLKLLLVIYLAAYLADRHSIRFSSLQLFTPTIVLTGIALLLLLVQRDLGTASIFIFLFTIIVFIVTGKKRVLLGAVILLSSALLIGYFFIDIIHIRVESWLNPWNDPAGHSYQIVQSLLAIANGGTTGRGPGLGSPLLVPVAVSDFIFAALVEESGLVGTIGLIITIWLILSRGIIASLRAADRFRRFLADRNRNVRWISKSAYHWRKPAAGSPNRGYPSLCVLWWLFAGYIIYCHCNPTDHQRAGR